MKYLILAALVVGLITMASGVFAYEFAEHECQVEADSWQRMQDQRRLDQTLQAQRQQQEQRSLQENKHFNPQAYNAPAPWNMYDQKTGRTSDYRRGVSG